MKKGEIFTATVDHVDFPNKGVVYYEDQTFAVKNVLPGQEVSLMAGKKRKGKAEARLLEVVAGSPIETNEAPCEHAGACGGCSYQTVSYENQLKLKEEMVKKLIRNSCPEEAFEGIKGSPSCDGYRNKMEFSFGDEIKDGPLSLGMHKRGSFHDIVTVGKCKICDQDFGRVLMATLELCKEWELPFYHKMRHEGYLRHLLVRKAWKTGEIMAALVTSGQTEGIFGERTEADFLENWKNCMEALPLDGHFAGILHMRNDVLADMVQSDETTILAGQEFFFEEILGLRFKITPFSFFQTNSRGAEVLYETAREFIGDTKDKLVYDLYSGTGTIAQVLAPVASKVIGVEIVEEAVEAAKENAKRNGLENCEFLAGDVLKVIDEIEEKPDLIVLDPPRDGIHPKALPKIISYGVPRIVYISCKPTSLARDLPFFTENGYRVVRAVAVDMFPNTANVETVVLLSK